MVARRACLVWRCRRGTQRLSRIVELRSLRELYPAAIRTMVWISSRTYVAAGMWREPPSPPAPSSRRQTLNPANAGFSFLGRDKTSEHSPRRVPGSVSDPAEFSLRYPPHLSAAQSKERAPARDYATASALPADPVRPAEHRSNRRGAQRTRPQSRTANAVLACGQNYAESPQLRLALTNARQGVAFEGGVGARGRAARPTNAGGNCENLQDLAGSE